MSDRAFRHNPDMFIHDNPVLHQALKGSMRGAGAGLTYGVPTAALIGAIHGYSTKQDDESTYDAVTNNLARNLAIGGIGGAGLGALIGSITGGNTGVGIRDKNLVR